MFTLFSKPSNEVVVFEWVDSCPTGAIGWVVLDRIINGIAGGGIFAHANATLQEVKDVAKNMTYKFTVCNPQIGGAKAAIRFDHCDPRFEGVLKRFLQYFHVLLKDVWVTAGDLNTQDTVIEKIIQQDLGLPTCQSALARMISKNATQGKDRSLQLAKWINTDASPFFPLIEGAVGYGLMSAIKEIIEMSKLLLYSPNVDDIKEGESRMMRVMIQGFGAVGSSLAYFLEKEKIAMVVGIADIDGFIHDSNGLPIKDLLEIRENAKKFLHIDADTAKISKNIICNLNEEKRKKYNCVLREDMSSEDFFIKFLQSEEAEIICPCAQRYQITQKIVDCLLTQTWLKVPTDNRFIVSGANNPFGIYDSNKKILGSDDVGVITKILSSKGVCVVPDWVANSGTAQLFHNVLSMDFRNSDEVLKACAMPIVEFMRHARLRCKKLCDLPFGCNMVAEERIQNPISIKNKMINELQFDIHNKISFNPAKSRYVLPPLNKNDQLSLKERIRLCLSIGCERKKDEPQGCIEQIELERLLQQCPNPVAYDGFEPSGRMHIAQGIMKMITVKKMTDSGFTYIFWIADWFAQLNHKMDGDLEKIRILGRYFIEIWKALCKNMNIKSERIRYLWAAEEILGRINEYYQLLIDISSSFSVKRITKCCTIMGREEKNLYGSGILYSVMQCADIFFLGVDVCQLGLDQLKVNVLAREYADKKNSENKNDPNIRKPIILSHTMLPGLRKGQSKMSKSDITSAIFMEDNEETIALKIKEAFCPDGEIDISINPILAYMKFLVFDHPNYINGVKINEIVYKDYVTFSEDYKNMKILPQQVKHSLIIYLNEIIQPVRDHFNNDIEAKKLLQQVMLLRHPSNFDQTSK